uniref:Cuticular protein 71 n=1 Tax=Leptinotarsa decemlineata TaxID=7539 RepID=A0A3Q8HG34_LEPDE|nr:larval cuticle protein A2B-like [Leptinotarsa decemlineata]AYA49964.1 cuticular protein 71 [Leptinotarsa decemlineata]
MAFKLIAFATCLAAAQAGIIPAAPLAYSTPVAYAAPIAKVAAPLAYAAPVAKAVVSEEYDPHPQYNYAYDIQDGLTGDSKSQHESRDGDVVQGSYSLIDADGFKRTVDYTADPIHGFNAVVNREPLVQKAVVAKVAAPVAYAAPVAKIAAPFAYAQPAIAKVAYSAPVAQYYH